MRRRFPVVAVVAMVAVACPVAGAQAGARAAIALRAGAGPMGGRWGLARQVPGTAVGEAEALAVSCPSPGECAAVGYDGTPTGPQHIFVADETRGRWGRAQQVAEALAGVRGGKLDSVSCASAGNCSAGGYYLDANYSPQALVVSEVNGHWGSAEEVPGTAALNKAGNAQVLSVSCASAGNCSAGGAYFTLGSHRQTLERAFVADQTHGVWGQARQVAGNLVNGDIARVNSVSCGSPGNCVAGGQYDTPGQPQAFVVSEVNGRWRPAEQVPGTATLNKRGTATVISVSCPAPGQCSAGGDVDGGYTGQQAFVVNETGGVWGKAQEVAVALNHGASYVDAVSCAAPGDCAAGGTYTDRASTGRAFVISQAHGRWGQAQQIARNLGPGGAQVNSVSCASPGNCTAGGLDEATHGNNYYVEAFVAAQSGGRWEPAEQIPGIVALNGGGAAETGSVSCATPDHCSAAGGYQTRSLDYVAFVADKT